MGRFTVATVLTTVLAIMPPMNSQTAQGDILGAVRDTSGAGVPSADVIITNEATKAARKLQTDERGEFHAVGLYVGTYSVEAMKEGFTRLVIPGVRVVPAALKRVELPLQVGSVKEAVTVAASSPVVETEGATVNGRVPSTLYDKPMVDISRSGWALSPAMYAPGSSGGANGFFLWFGATGSQTEMTMEGNQQPDSFFTNPHSVEEVSLTGGTPPAEYARAVTANVTLKSGNNELHGMYAVSLSNSATSAVNSPFTRNPVRPPGFPQWRHEFNVGGPVYVPGVYDGRDRTFFFVDFWKPRGSFLIRPTSASIPTQAMRAGNFSGFPTKPKDPLTGELFPNGIIPSSRVSPVATAAMADLYAPFTYFGDPNNFANNAQTEGFSGGAQNALTTRFDQNVRTSHIFNYSYYRAIRDDVSSAALSSPAATTRSNFNTVRQSRINSNRHSLGWTWTATPTVVNQLRLGVTRYVTGTQIVRGRNDRTPVLGKDQLTQWGIQGVVPTNDSGYPVLTISNWNGVAFAASSANYDTRYQYTNNLTLIKGKHSLKFGVAGIKSHEDNPFIPGFGNFQFDGRFTGEPFADFLLGLPNTFTRTLPRTAIARRIWEHGLYAQDEWRVNPRFTLSYGLRWDYFTAPYDKNNQYFTFDLATGSIVVPDDRALAAVNPAFPSAVVPITTADRAGYPEKLTNPTGRFLPRIGFAYRPTGNPTFVIRGGYGIYQGTLRFAALQTGGPFAVTESFINGFVDGRVQYSFPNPFPGLGSANASTGASVTSDFRPEYTQTWNISLEKEVARGWGVRITYMGNKSTQMAYQYDANTPLISTAPFTQSRRPFSAFQSINRIETGANDRYNALQVVLNRPLMKGLYMQLSFTEQRSINDIGGGGLTGFNRSASPGYFSLDYAYDRVRDQGYGQWPKRDFVANWDYTLPFGKGRTWLSNADSFGKKLLSAIVSDWSVTGVMTWRSGHFFTPRYTGFDPGNINKFTGRPNVVPGCEIYTGNPLGDSQHYINLNCFTIPEPGTLGNAKINSLETPAAFILSASPWKEFRLPRWERGRLRFGANIYNVTNTPTYGALYSSLGVVNSPVGALLGPVEARRDTETWGQRSMVFSARFLF